jgi:pimeloyl-ACP methyl ester carboxylesterase
MKYTEGDIRLNEINIHYYRTGGNKPPFVLLHGATDNGLCWTPVAEELADRYDVIMPDALGHGLSDRLNPDSKSGNSVTLMVMLIEGLGLDKPVIMGHSMGAGTTIGIAIEYPILPRAIILEDPGWRTEEELALERDESRIHQRESFIKTFTGYGKRTLEELINECRTNNPLWSEAEIGPWAASKLQFDPALFSAGRFEMPSYIEQVPRIQCPILLITAENGIVSAKTAEHASKLWASKSIFRSVRIKGAGHNIRRERYDEFMAALNHFLEEIYA